MFEIPIDDSFYFKLIWFFVLFIKDEGNIGTCYDFKNNFSIFFLVNTYNVMLYKPIVGHTRDWICLETQ